MKKLCTKSAGIDLKFSRFPFIKVLSLTSIAALLSSVSPVLAKNLDSKEEISTNIKNVAVVYPQSVISAYHTSTGYLEPLDVSKDNYVTVLNTALIQKVSASAGDSDYANFLTSTLSDGSDDNFVVNAFRADGSNRSKRAVNTEEEKKQSIISPQLSVRNSMSSQQLAQHDENTAIIGVFDASRDDSTAIAQPDAGLQRANTSVNFGKGSQTPKNSSVAVGYMAHAMGESSTALGGEYNATSEHGENDYTTANGDYSTALGSVSRATADGATAVGHRAYATGEQSISVGFYSKANKERSVTLGDYAVTEVVGGVALGSASVSNVAAGIEGYSPLRTKEENTNFVWKSTEGAVSVGDISKSKTRQIGGVAAGKEDTDAVNIAQLKSLQTYVDKGWKLSVEGKNTKAVGVDDTVDFAAGSKNLEITKGGSDNNIKFDLAKNITLKSVKITDGPQITTEGINAGSQKITNVATGTNATDAVNFAQLKAIQEAAVVKGLKINTTGNDFKDAIADGESSVAIGSEASASKESSVALGAEAQATVNSGVAIGAYSVADVAADIVGYSPLRKDASKNPDYVWKSKLGAVSVSNKAKMLSRQITGVAAGTQDTDAVNIAQLKELQTYVDKGWKLSVNGANDKVVAIDGSIDLAAGSSNFEITKGTDDNKITFDLAKNITLDSLTAGTSTLDGTGLKIADGPQITTEGMNVDGKKITGLAEGTDETDAVNFGQLQKIEKQVEQQVAASSFVKQDDKTKYITIGKDTDGDKIDITNNKNEKRILAGIKGGDVTEDSTDAINGSQLFATNQKVITYFGGGAEYKDGKWFAPTFKVKRTKADGTEEEKIYKNVAEAFEGIGTTFTNINDDITNQINNAITKMVGESFIQQDKETNRLTIGAKTEGIEINIANKSGGNRIISGVDDAKNSNDAVNKGQLDNSIKSVTDQLTHITQQVQGDALLWSESDGAFVAKHGEEKMNSKLKFLLNGDITADSTDAINGSQLYSISNKLAGYFGGGAGYNEKGEWKEPTFKVRTVKEDGNSEEKTYPDVAKALEGVGSSITNVQNKMTNDITNQINNAITKMEGESFIQQDKETNRLTIGAKTEGTEISIANASGANRIISGVDDAKNNNDAVNKGQLDNSIKSVTDQLTNITQQVQGDSLLWSASDGAFVAQHGEEKAKSKLKFLLNGDITADSTDAINGSQLYSMSNNLAAYFSDGAGYDKNGEWKAPTFKVNTVKKDGTAGEESYDTVEKAFSAVGTSFTNIQNTITNEITKEINKTKGDALLWSESDRAFVAQHGKEKTNSKISFLANGDITKNSMDAINGSQLYAVINSLTGYFGGGAEYKDGQWKEPTFYVSQFKVDGSVDDKKKDYNNVAAAFEGVNGSLSSINERINNVAKDVSLSGLNWNETEKAYDANHNGKPSKITHVEKGSVTAVSTDAVNGSQLFETNNRVTKVEESVKDINQKVENIKNTVTNDAVKYDKNDKGDKINKVTLAGVSESDPVVLDNVAAGELSKDSKQAVNGSQLWETNQQIDVVLDKAKTYTDERFNDIINHQMGDVINEAKSYTDMKFDALNYSIEGVRKEARQAAAIGIAVANLRYNETPGKLSVGFGTGLWRNKSAFAFGAGYTSESGSVLSNVSVTNSGGHWGIGAGFNMTLN
ncbi:Vomp family autotransporter [Bartonella sp. ML70XJBT.G]|uniref:Vomp family autotransporter n=1 Tax=Bartonella sp. ML70XJBT.G TaxID=3019093 RepID=UPI0023606A5B|nr:Vomp family autotransporter [Bartonella sp. ML70XJBT.G]